MSDEEATERSDVEATPQTSEKSEYARREEVRHRRKIVLPVVIPWEYGSNKYASQKGTGGFGGARDATLKVFCSTPFLKHDETTLPKFATPNTEHGTQAGSAPMGKFRDQVIMVKDQNNEDLMEINKLLPDKNNKRERTLRKWDQPNINAKNSDVFGKKRDVICTPTGGRRFTPDEQAKCRAAIPRFQDPRNTIAALSAKPGESLVTGLTRNRQATTEIEGLDRTTQDQLDSNRYMAWIGGQITIQSQSQTGGFQKPRDVVSNNTYEKVTRARDTDPRALRSRRKQRNEDKIKEEEESKALIKEEDEETIKAENETNEDVEEEEQ